MEQARTIECVVRGETISHLGLRRALFSADPSVGYRTVDGVSTEAGPICGVCMPAYEAAVGRISDKSVGQQLEDKAFVEGVIREHARERVFAILRDFREVLLRRDVKELKDFLLRGIDLRDYAEVSDCYDVSGTAEKGGLDLKRALACMNEESRTFKFIQALFLHLHDLEKRRDEIEVVDGGCGPIPLFGIMAALKSEKVRATCLEVNPYSVRMAQQIVKNLGLSDRVKVVLADARQYKHDKPIDLLISETMYVGLTEEPLAQIFANLVPQVAEGGVVVPEWVTIDAGLIDARQFYAISEQYPGMRFASRDFIVWPLEVLRLTRTNLATSADFRLPLNEVSAGSYRLVLASRVGLHGVSGLELTGLESKITAPCVIPGDIVVGDVAKGVSVAVKYELGGPIDRFWEMEEDFS